MSTAEREGEDGQTLEHTQTAEPAQSPEAESTSSLLELLLAHQSAAPQVLADRIDGIVMGYLTTVDSAGAAHVTFPGAPEQGFAARSMTVLRTDDAGREVALMFEGGDPRRPVVMGRMVSPLAPPQPDATGQGAGALQQGAEAAQPGATQPGAAQPLAAKPSDAVVDNRRVEINAEQEIVLRCGDSSITLTRAGKIIIRGAYVLSRSSGVNRIQGGSVEIN